MHLVCAGLEQKYEFISQNVDRIREELDKFHEEMKELNENKGGTSKEIQEKEEKIAGLRKTIEDSGELFAEIGGEIEKYKAQREELNQKHKVFLQKREDLSKHMAELDKEVFRLESQKEGYEEASEKQINYMWEEYELTYNRALELRNGNLTDLAQMKKRIQEIKNGKCVDTSMGLTPLEGLIMGTRSGDIDPAIIEFLAHKENKSIDEIMNILNKKSGVLGLSNNLSSDFRDLEEGYHKGDTYAACAMKTFAYRVAKYIGAYTAAMNGVDLICFTAGVGENAALVRTMICEYLGYLGVTLDQEANGKRGEDIVISTPDSRTKVMVIPTNEELAIARETVRLV